MHAVQYHHRSNVVPRFQWNYNSGYCGETSFICAGLNFGQYCSQWKARELFIRASGGGLEQYDAQSQLLLLGSDGDADKETARAMRLQASKYPEGDGADLGLIGWAKRELLNQHVPIIGVFNNVIMLKEFNWRTDGDPEYDHIVPIVGFGSDHTLTKRGLFPSSDVITLSDNGLYGPFGDNNYYPFLFSYEVQVFQGTREQANNPAGAPIYMLRHIAPHYGISIEGVMDADQQSIPVLLGCSSNSEPNPTLATTPTGPDLASAPLADTRPSGISVQLTATVDLPYPGEQYNLYCYTDFDDVPFGGFNQHARNNPEKVTAWHILPGQLDAPPVQPVSGKGPPLRVTTGPNGVQAIVNYDANSNDMVVFRAVPGGAP